MKLKGIPVCNPLYLRRETPYADGDYDNFLRKIEDDSIWWNLKALVKIGHPLQHYHFCRTRGEIEENPELK